MKVQRFLGLFYLFLFVSKFEMFVLSTSIPRFKFLHICSIFLILISIFQMLVLNAKERHIELF